ncbi:MAG: T9SS type A sorting domain-containing protein [Cyclobacteriaceae bacterium]
MKKILLIICLLFVSSLTYSQGVKVEVKLIDGEYQLYRDGSPYFIKGVCHSGHFLDSLPAYGGNSIRTYSVDTTKFAATTTALLDKADSLGLTVTVGLYIGHEEFGFDYNDTTAVKEQLEDFRYYIKKWRDHPAVLMWAIGNEADARYTNYRLWDAVNDISEMIHEEDSLHPTMTVIASPHDPDLIGINERAPDLDVLGINNYRSLDNTCNQIRGNSFTRPYVVTEWGVDGTWGAVPKTSWGAPIELSSTSKAYVMRNRYTDYILGDLTPEDTSATQCIRELNMGAYKFIWGRQNHGEVESWFSIFNVLGEATEEAESLQYLWTGSYPSQRAPRITEMKLNGHERDDDVSLYNGAINSAYVSAYDPNDDALTYEWAIVEEGYELDDATSGNSFPGITGLITQTSDSTVVFNTPSEEGAYRLYVVVHDGHNKIALDGIAFQVIDNSILRNYDGISLLEYESVIGGSHNGSVNPDSTGINQTPGVGKFNADGTSSYAKLTFSNPVVVEDASYFKSGDFEIKMEVRTSAPIGTEIQLNFENEASYGSSPDGRNSTYKKATTVQNEWEIMTFDYNSSPDPDVSDLEVDQFTFTFDPGNSSNYIYYFDNIRIERVSPDDVGEGDVFENYDGDTPTISYDDSNGTYSIIENSFPGGSNDTDSTSMYIRSGVSYDALKFDNTVIADASIYESGDKEFVIDLNTAAPLGTVLEIQLRNTSMVGSYPDGRHSIYRTKVLERNTWYQARFKHISSPDTTVGDSSVDQMIFFLSPGVVSSDTFYIDNIQDIVVNEEPGLLAPWENTDIGSVGIAGSTSSTTNGSLFTLTGSGTNIWGTSDEFQYAYQSINVEDAWVEIICKVQSITPDQDDYVKAGLMFRETLDDDAKHAMIYVTPESGNAFQYRSSVAGSCSKTSNATSIDRWLKLKRVGDRFEGYQSNDGVTWSLIDSVTISMNSSMYVGLALTSHDNAEKATTKIRNITLELEGSGSRKAVEYPFRNDQAFMVYPNPTNDYVFFEISKTQKANVNIYGLDGRSYLSEVYKSQDGKYKVNLSSFNKGVYLMEIRSNNGSYKRLIIKN